MEISPHLNGLKFVLLSTRMKTGSPSVSLYNRAYSFWTSFWNDVYLSVGDDDKANADQFRRQDVLSIILHGENIVAMHCYTFFNLESTADRDHSYFAKYFTKKAMNGLDQRKVKSVMSMEYFSVAKEWQKKSHNIAMGIVLLTLGLKFFLELDCDMWVGTPRADIGIAKLCYSIGAAPLDQGLTIHGALSDIIGGTRALHWPGTEDDKALAERLWNKKDLRFDLPSAAPNRKAA